MPTQNHTLFGPPGSSMAPPPGMYGMPPAMRGMAPGTRMMHYPAMGQPPFPQRPPRIGLFVLSSEMANRAAADLRRAENRYESVCHWHMATIPPMTSLHQAAIQAGCSQGPSTSSAQPFPLPSEPEGASSPMNPPTVTKATTGRGTKRKGSAQSLNTAEHRHKSVSTPSPHFNSPLPQPLSVPSDAVLSRSHHANSSAGMNNAPFGDNHGRPGAVDPRRAASATSEFMTPPPTHPDSSTAGQPEVNGTAMHGMATSNAFGDSCSPVVKPIGCADEDPLK